MVAVPPVAVTVTTAIVHGELHALLEAPDPVFDVARLARAQAPARRVVQPVLDPVGLVAQTVGSTLADHIATVETIDLPLDTVDPRLKRPDLAPIASETVAV